jgi:hypothetical protein
MEDNKRLTDEIWKLYRKADQLRSMHYYIKEKYSFWSKMILAYVTIGSAIDSMLIFADVNKETQFWIGISAASIFIVSLIPSTFSIESKISERNLAGKLWGEWVRSASNFCNTEIEILSNNIAIDRQKELVENYKKIMNETPSIPNRLFNKFKQKHLQKIEISKLLDKKPFKSIRSIKKELKKENGK